MTTLLISPDYASHYYGLAALGHARLRTGDRVVVATGPALAARVRADGFEHAELVLGAGSNDGQAGPESLPEAERENLRGFFAATRQGMAATLAFQVAARENDMLWRPEAVTARLREILDRLRPEHVVVDQLAFSATLALRALQRRFVSFLPSHPCQLPRPGDPDGYPVRYPAELSPPPHELAALHALCTDRAARFTGVYNAALARLNPGVAPLDDVVSTPAPELTVIAYPHELAPDAARPGIALVGSVVRDERPDPELAGALADRRPDRPTVYVGLGTFLSARDDVLRVIADGLRTLDVNAILSTGTADPAVLGPLPAHWHARATLPQVAAIAASDVVVCHGGNNTVMEALTSGVPVLAGPFSSDQFVAAEDLRRGEVGDAFDPNRAEPADLARRIARLLDGAARHRAAALGARLRARPGAHVAWELIDGQRA